MVTIDWRGGENDGGGSSIIRIRENDGGGRVAAADPLTLGELPGWNESFGSAATGVVHPIVGGAVFPPDGWDPAILIDEIALGFANIEEWKKAQILPPPEQSAEKPNEKFAQDVQAFKDARQITFSDNIKEEIRFQVDDIISYFMKLSSCSPSVRSETHFLLMLSLRVGSIAVRHFKRQFNRARPTQVMPWVDTVIPTPRHAAYPSGHAMQAYLMAKVVTEVAPQLGTMADKLAEKIALKRVLAGVHFPSDNDVSKKLVDPVWTSLLTVGDMMKRVADAKEEHTPRAKVAQ